MSEQEKNNEDLKELVLARIGVMPSNFKLSIGSFGTFTKDEMISSVEKGDSVGKQIVQMQMNFINALSSGKLIETLNQNE